MTILIDHTIRLAPSLQAWLDKITDIANLKEKLMSIETSVAALTTNLDALEAGVVKEKGEVKAKFDAFQAEIDTLKTQIAAGDPATVAQLDSLAARVAALAPSVDSISDPVVPPPPPPDQP